LSLSSSVIQKEKDPSISVYQKNLSFFFLFLKINTRKTEEFLRNKKFKTVLFFLFILLLLLLLLLLLFLLLLLES
jgi:hypothetical protein